MNEIEQLYGQYYKDLYGYVFSLTLNHYQTEDIVSNTFLTAINSIHTFKQKSSIKTWLIGIARHEYYAYLKKNPLNMQLDSIQEPTYLPIDNNTEEILKAIQNFEEPLRQIMVLRLINQLSFVEIGMVVGRSETYSRVSFFRGKQKLVEVLNDEM